MRKPEFSAFGLVPGKAYRPENRGSLQEIPFFLCYLSRRTGYPDVNSSLTEESVSVNRPSLVQPVGCRQVMSTGIGIALVVAGAIVRFAVPATVIYGLNVHVVGVIVMLAGVIALLLSLLVWGPLSRRRNHSGEGHAADATAARGG
jgi:hypothetical protein